MKILIVSSYLPYPIFSGGHIRLYNLIKELSKEHKVTLICEKREWQTDDDVLEVEKFCFVLTVPRKKQWSIGNVLKTGFSKNPFLVVGHTSKEMKRKIKDILKQEKFDIIHVETFYVMQNLPKTNLPVVLAEHNIEYLVYKRFADQASLVLKPFYYLDVLKMKILEESCWKKAAKLIAVSDDEKRMMNGNDVAVVSNGVDVTKFKVESSKLKVQNGERRILFIGDFKWLQNRNSAEWILREIWPKIKSKVKGQKSKLDIKLWVVGRNIPDSIKKLTNDKSVIFDENADDTAKIFSSSFLLLAPIRVGGGTSYKILEAMASGIPVVTTKLGIEGIEAKDNSEVLLGEGVEELSNQALKILKDPVLYEKIAENARKLIEEKYDWRKITKELDAVYNSV